MTSIACYTNTESQVSDANLVLHDRGASQSYRDLRVWQQARDLSVALHRLTLNHLPRFEMQEEGSQLRRASKSVRANIVEGFGRRYKRDFLKHLTYAEASCDEAVDHLDTLFETGSITDRALYEELRPRLLELSRSLNRFIAAVEQQHQSSR